MDTSLDDGMDTDSLSNQPELCSDMEQNVCQDNEDTKTSLPLSSQLILCSDMLAEDPVELSTKSGLSELASFVYEELKKVEKKIRTVKQCLGHIEKAISLRPKDPKRITGVVKTQFTVMKVEKNKQKKELIELEKERRDLNERIFGSQSRQVTCSAAPSGDNSASTLSREKTKSIFDELLPRMTEQDEAEATKVARSVVEDIIQEAEKIVNARKRFLFANNEIPENCERFAEEVKEEINFFIEDIEIFEFLEISSIKDVTILRRHFKSLDGKNWLFDEVINFYFMLIVQRNKFYNFPSVYACDSFFYTSLLKNGTGRALKWKKPMDLFSSDIILIPLHLGFHWALCVIDNRSTKIKYYDSMARDQAKDDKIIKPIREYLIGRKKSMENITMDPIEYQLEVVKGLPKQSNTFDCGMFVIKYADFLSRDVPITFTQEQIPFYRMLTAYEIMKKTLM